MDNPKNLKFVRKKLELDLGNLEHIKGKNSYVIAGPKKKKLVDKEVGGKNIAIRKLQGLGCNNVLPVERERRQQNLTIVRSGTAEMLLAEKEDRLTALIGRD